MDPSSDELAGFVTLQQVLDRAEIPDIIMDAFYEETGTLMFIRELASLADIDFTNSIMNTKVPVLAADVSGTVIFRDLKPVEMTRLLLARRAGRLRCGLIPDEAQGGPTTSLSSSSLGPPPQATQLPPASSGGGVELGSVWDQSSRAQVTMLGPVAVKSGMNAMGR